MPKLNGWVLTDEDTLQYVFRRADDVFSLILVWPRYECRHKGLPAQCQGGCSNCCVCRETVCLDDYTEEEINEYISWFDYESIDEIKEKYGESWKQIIAECIFELDVSDCVLPSRFFGSYEQCKKYIEEVVYGN